MQTCLDFVFVFILLSVLLNKINPQAYNRRKLLITALSIEGVHVISSFLWYFLVLYAIGGFIIELLFLFLIPFFVIYLFYTQNSESLNTSSTDTDDNSSTVNPYLSTGQSWLVYLLSVPPALIASCFLTSFVLNLLGVYNIFIFS